jgi:hypothetical protein
LTLASLVVRVLTSSGSQSGVNKPKPMTKPTILVRPTAPQGFRWQIIADGKTLKSGTTATEFEARTMAKPKSRS